MLIINTTGMLIALKGTVNDKSTHVHLAMGKNRVADNFVPDALTVARYGNKMHIDKSFINAAPAPDPVSVAMQIPNKESNIHIINKEIKEAAAKPKTAAPSTFTMSASSEKSI